MPKNFLLRMLQLLRSLVTVPPVRMIIAFFWVGGSIGLGSAASALLPGTLRFLSPLGLAAGALLGYYAFVRLIESRQPSEISARGSVTEVLAGAVIGAVLFSLVIGVLFLLGVYEIEGVNPERSVIASLVAAVMAGITEEVLMRAIAFRMLEEWLGSWIALVLTAALFGLLHLPNPHATAVSSAAIALEAGVMLGAAYLVTRRIWLAVGIHVAWNFTQSGIFGVATSGVNEGGYFKGTISGADALTGGAFGPEASVVSVVLCLSLGLVFLWIVHMRGGWILSPWRRIKP